MLPIAVASVFSAKLVHVYAHLKSLTSEDLALWGSSFFLQDVAFILLVRLLLDARIIFAPLLASVLSTSVFFLTCTSIACFMTIGTEPDWRNAAIALDPAWWAVLPAGLASFAMVGGGILFIAAVSQQFCQTVADMALDIVLWPVRKLLRRKNAGHQWAPVPTKDEDETGDAYDDRDGHLTTSGNDVEQQGLYIEKQLPAPSKSAIGGYIIIGAALLIQIGTTILRPVDQALTMMSRTVILSPIVELTQSTPAAVIPTQHTSGPNSISDALKDQTALTSPIPFGWLPEGDAPAGFEDWYDSEAEHYNAENDPLKIANMLDDVLPALRNKLAGVDIRHIVLVKMESIRKDVFPVKQGGKIWKKLENSYQNKTLPKEVQERLATLTRTANTLTCDYEDGFAHENKTCRGGISVNNAFTSSSYTLKSVLATLCGIGPVAADFNVESDHHFYQPCLAHIFDIFGKLNRNETEEKSHEFSSFPWKSFFFQSTTDSFDHQASLMPVLGYDKDTFITKEYLQSESARHGKSNLADVNYFSIPEISLEEYIKDAFRSAKENDERVFLTHLTSTTHHAFGIPSSENYVKMSEDKDLDDLSHYVNAVGYGDRWMARILEMLEQEGVANQTLVVFAGDHGMPVAEGGVATYNNDETASFHVPIVFSHPDLPHLDIQDPSVTMQILPTILDLLIESGSLSKSAKQAANDLVRNYEGQSFLRPMRKISPKNGQGDWQISVTNPGGSTLAIRDARHPEWRLTVPIVDGIDWHYIDNKSNSTGKFSLSFDSLRNRIERDLGEEVANWAEEAAVVSHWWLEENQKRWRYGKYGPEDEEDKKD